MSDESYRGKRRNDAGEWVPSSYEQADESAPPSATDEAPVADEGLRQSGSGPEPETEVAASGDRGLEHRGGRLDADGPAVGGRDDPLPGVDAQLLAVEQRWFGPLPPPNALAHYESVLPGTAERIVKMAENAAEVRNDALRDTTNAEIEYARNGQSLAFVLTVIAFIAAVAFFAFGNEVAGCALISLPVVMLIRSFLGRFGDD